MYVSMNECIYLCMYIFMYVYMYYIYKYYVCMYVCLHMCMYTYTCKYTYAYTHINMEQIEHDILNHHTRFNLKQYAYPINKIAQMRKRRNRKNGQSARYLVYDICHFHYSDVVFPSVYNTLSVFNMYLTIFVDAAVSLFLKKLRSMNRHVDPLDHMHNVSRYM